MNPAIIAIIIALIKLFLTALPEIIADVEKIIADLKNAPPPGPITPGVVSDMSQLEDALKASGPVALPSSTAKK